MYGEFSDKEKAFMKWCEGMPKDFMRFMWRLYILNYATSEFLDGDSDTVTVRDMGTIKPFRYKEKPTMPPIQDSDIIEAAKKMDMSIESIQKIMKHKPTQDR